MLIGSGRYTAPAPRVHWVGRRPGSHRVGRALRAGGRLTIVLQIEYRVDVRYEMRKIEKAAYFGDL
jgi:hypothetical protein